MINKLLSTCLTAVAIVGFSAGIASAQTKASQAGTRTKTAIDITRPKVQPTGKKETKPTVDTKVTADPLPRPRLLPAGKNQFRTPVEPANDTNGTVQSGDKPAPPEPASRAPIYPHDFSDMFYVNSGVNVKLISQRLTGYDFLSTVSKVSHPDYADVRVLVTLPAYTGTGEAIFFNPLGFIDKAGFMQDVEGANAQAMAERYPIYVFGNVALTGTKAIFGDMRQAPIVDLSWSDLTGERNALGLRQIVSVSYTDAVETAEGQAILNQLIAKNGTALDGGPIVNDLADIKLLVDNGLITLERGVYAIAPVLATAAKGGIAADAFISTVTKDGQPLEAERFFVSRFECLKNSKTCFSTAD